MRSVARTPPDVHQDIVLVEINDTTIRDLDPVFGRWPWPRVTFSMLVDFLNRAPAKVIAVDLGFYERDRVLQHQIGTEKWSGAESDDALVKSVKEARNTILLADAVYEGLVSGEQANKAAEWRSEPYRLDRRIFERRTIITPYRELNDAVATLGHSFAALDAGGSLRRIVPFIRFGDRFMPSLGVAAAVRGADIQARRSHTRWQHASNARPSDTVDSRSCQRRDQRPDRGPAHDAGQLPCAGFARHWRAAVPELRGAAHSRIGDPAAVGRPNPRSIPRCSRTRSFLSVSRRPVSLMSSRHRSTAGGRERCRASRCTRALPTAFSPTD